jgi:hypothetical protein
MAKKQAEDRRFIHDLDSVIFHANEGSLRETFNLFCYFGSEVIQDCIPDKRAMEFVSKSLVNSLPKKKLGRLRRNYDIKRLYVEELENGNSLTPSRGNTDNAAFLVSEKFNLSEDRATALKYVKPHPILIIEEELSAGKTPSLTTLQSVLPYIVEIHKRLLNKSGQNIRSLLSLKGYGWWNESIPYEVDINKEVEYLEGEIGHLEAYKIVAGNYGLTTEAVRKVHERKIKRKK